MAGAPSGRRPATALLAALLTVSACSKPPAPLANAPAGAALVHAQRQHNTLQQPAPALSPQQRLDFSLGRSFFRNPWVTAPSTTTARDGLGPLYNANSCAACHQDNGRGRTPEQAPRGHGLLLRLSATGANNTAPELGITPHPLYGGQLQIRAVPGAAAEGQLQWQQGLQERVFADGHRVQLQRPHYRIANTEAQPQLSPRLAPPLIGLGLLDAIADQTLLASADPDDRDGDGISGRVNQVWDVQAQRLRPGRFGWKAGQPTLLQQVAAAFSEDMGITSALFPSPVCPAANPQCRGLPQGGAPEINAKLLGAVSDYVASLALPPFANTDDPLRQRGWQQFQRAGCQHCHQPQQRSGPHHLPWLANQTFYPFTDLLLHDMGEGLADHRAEFGANGREWRTAPLWGLGWQLAVAGDSRFLHDGRARNLLEAILWHGGEAQSSTQAVLAMDASDRDALIYFLSTL